MSVPTHVWPAFSSVLLSAVFKFASPPSTKRLYRGVNNLYGLVPEAGSLTVWRQYTSCAMSLNQHVVGFSKGVMIVCLHGVPPEYMGHVDHVSIYPTEEEVRPKPELSGAPNPDAPS